MFLLGGFSGSQRYFSERDGAYPEHTGTHQDFAEEEGGGVFEGLRFVLQQFAFAVSVEVFNSFCIYFCRLDLGSLAVSHALLIGFSHTPLKCAPF